MTTANQVYTAPGTVTVTATAAASSGHTISQVQFYQGSTLIGTATSSPYTITWNSVAAGSYSITAKATDNLGVATTSTAVPITVAALTVTLTAPTNNQVFAAPATSTATVTTTGGGIARVDYYANGALIASGTTSPSYSVTVSNVAAGTYTITAQAKDSGGTLLATSSAITAIVDTPPTVSLTAPTANQVYPAPGTVTVTATAVASSGHTISQVQFYQGATLIGTATSSPYTITWSSVAAGSYSITAKATDNLGVATTSSAVAIIVDTPPTVSLTAPTANQVYTAPGTVTVTATAAASSGHTISQVQFYQGATLIGTATSSPYTITWNSVAAGSYSITAVATDSLSVQTTSSPVTITVSAQGTVYYVQPDQLGTPRLITNASNQIVWRNLPTTEPFGNSPPEENPSGLGVFQFNLRFPGQYADSETNTNYNYFRDYNPATGRYVQADPIGLRGGLNPYLYASANPLSRVDPSGLAVTPAGAVAGFAVCSGLATVGLYSDLNDVSDALAAANAAFAEIKKLEQERNSCHSDERKAEIDSQIQVLRPRAGLAIAANYAKGFGYGVAITAAGIVCGAFAPF